MLPPRWEYMTALTDVATWLGPKIDPAAIVALFECQT
jgi:hypothetical protein